MRNLNFNVETGSEPYTPTAQSSTAFSASESFYSPDFRGDFGAGLLDLHSMDDMELLSDVRRTYFVFGEILFYLLQIARHSPQ